MFAAAQLPVSWGMAGDVPPALRHAVERCGGDVLRVAPDLLPLQGRHDVARWLQSRTAPTTAIGLTGAQAECVAAHWDLLVRHGIRAIRTAGCGPLARGAHGPAGRGKLSQRPTAIRFGLWQLPVTLSVPEADPAAVRWHLRHIRPGDCLHLCVDAAGLAARGPALRRWEAEVRRLGVAQQRGEVRAVTISGLVECLSAGRRASPSRSILRAA
jgi:hypothetical protein